MRVCDFIKHLYGDLTVKIFTQNDSGFYNKLLRENKIDDLKTECDESFNVLCGFDCALWEMTVKEWKIDNNIVYVGISK